MHGALSVLKFSYGTANTGVCTSRRSDIIEQIHARTKVGEREYTSALQLKKE